MYLDGQELTNKPHFNLIVTGELTQISGNKLRQVNIKVTYNRFKTQDGYDKFQQQVYEAILALDENLDSWKPTILYRCLEIYNLTSEFKVEQGDYLSGIDSSYISSRLAELFDLKIMRKSPESLDRRSMQILFTIQGKQVEIVNSHFIHWVLDLIKQKIKEDDYPYSFGLDMLNLQQALFSESEEHLPLLYKLNKPSKYMEGRQLIASFCIQLHHTICAIQGKSNRVFNSKQLRFYASLLTIFDLPNTHEYKLNASNQKMILDKLRQLLKRNSDI